MSTTPTQQPKALQLADRLKERIRQLNNGWNAKWNRSTEEFDLCAKSEDELRYQHAKIASLTAENEALKAERARSGLAHRKAVQEAVREALQEAQKACENLPAPDSCSGVERSLWDVATMACAEAVGEVGGTP